MLGRLELEAAQLAARLGLLERRYRRVRRELDEMTKADEIARTVAAELAQRERRHLSQLSGFWVKLGIVSVLASTAVTLALTIAAAASQ